MHNGNVGRGLFIPLPLLQDRSQFQVETLFLYTTEKYNAFSYVAVPPAFAHTDPNHIFIGLECCAPSALDGSVPFEQDTAAAPP